MHWFRQVLGTSRPVLPSSRHSRRSPATPHWAETHPPARLQAQPASAAPGAAALTLLSHFKEHPFS